MKSGSILAVLLAILVSVPVFAQSVTGDQVEKSLSPLTGMLEGVVNVGWTLMKFIIGKDDASIAYFTYQLGFRKNEVSMNITTTGGSKETCSMGSFTFNESNDSLICSEIEDGDIVAVGGNDNQAITKTVVTDLNEDGEVDVVDAFQYLVRNEYGELNISKAVQGQVILFSLVIPMGMFIFLLSDFFFSTGILRTKTVWAVSAGISLLAARSGVYTGLLSLVSSVFGSGGFFLSMFSIYLVMAVLLWFYGGVLKSKKMAESTKEVSDAVLHGFQYDLMRGIAGEEMAKELTRKSTGGGSGGGTPPARPGG